jgi:uncharacterized peroxidase-related enzyme
MPRIDAIDPRQAAPSVAPLLDAVKKQLGVTPNMMRTMAHSPAVLRGYLELNKALAMSSLGRTIGEQIALLTAERNGCDYCAAAHTALGKAAGLSDAAIDAARDGRGEDPRAAAALALAGAVIDMRGHVTDDALAAARSAGLSDGEIGEVVGHVALNVFTNYFNVLAGTDIDFPKVRSPRRPEASEAAAVLAS